jgi:hypothetical protein
VDGANDPVSEQTKPSSAGRFAVPLAAAIAAASLLGLVLVRQLRRR